MQAHLEDLPDSSLSLSSPQSMNKMKTQHVQMRFTWQPQKLDILFYVRICEYMMCVRASNSISLMDVKLIPLFPVLKTDDEQDETGTERKRVLSLLVMGVELQNERENISQ